MDAKEAPRFTEMQLTSIIEDFIQIYGGPESLIKDSKVPRVRGECIVL